MDKLKDKISQYGRWAPIDEYIVRIETHLDSDFSISLENAKALLESIGKEICKSKGRAQPNLSPIELSNMQFEIPPTKLLEGFSDAATPLLKKALSNNKQIQALIETRDGLLPRLMSNEINL